MVLGEPKLLGDTLSFASESRTQGHWAAVALVTPDHLKSCSLTRQKEMKQTGLFRFWTPRITEGRRAEVKGQEPGCLGGRYSQVGHGELSFLFSG